MIGASLAMIAGLLLPIALIVIDGVSNPQVMHTLADNPASTALLGVGIAIGLALLTVPLRSGLYRLGGAGTVRMADGLVAVERRGLLGTERWTAPLTSFCGVTHHIRATLSGPRHEIILVHPEPTKDLLLHLASRPPQEGAEHFAGLLGLAELQPKVLYSRHRTPAVAPRPIEIGPKAKAA